MSKPAAALLAVAIALTGCSKGPVTPSTLTITGTEYLFRAPVTVKGGSVNVTFQNTGRLAHQVQLMRLDAGLDPTSAVQALRGNKEGGFPDGIHGAGGTEEVSPGSSERFSLNLVAGSYLLLCFVGDKPHFLDGMVKPLTVAGGRSGALPASTGSLVARDYAYDVDGLQPGTQVVSVRNEGPKQPHIFELLEYPAGVTTKKVEAFVEAFRRNTELKGVPDPKPVNGFGALDPGGSATFETSLRAGRTYLLLCILSDRGSSRSHVLRGQYRVFRVS